MPMKWRTSPETLIQRFAELVPPDPRIERRKMFGYPAAFIAGNLFMGVHQEAVTLRLSEKDRASFLEIDGASVFEPMPGRPMREYVVVPASMIERPASLGSWIRRSLDYAGSIPPKGAKRTKRPATGSPARKRSAPKPGRSK
jgi:TfoX/Sxy family transcriptional regulator of competence genes